VEDVVCHGKQCPCARMQKVGPTVCVSVKYMWVLLWGRPLHGRTVCEHCSLLFIIYGLPG